MLSLFFLLLGLCIGSFLNVVIYRFNTGMSINGRSQCFSCGRALMALDLVPLFSWLAFRGKCRKCKSKISWQYPLVELATGLLFLAIYRQDGLSPALFFDLTIWSLLVVMTVYDIRHKIIPDAFVAAFAIVGLLRMLYALFFITGTFAFHSISGPMWLNLFAGPIFFVPFYILWVVSKGKWIGLGDGKLAIGIGTYLGFGYGLSAIMIGFWAGAIFGLIGLFFARNRLTMKSELPFAPFLILGILIVFFSGINVFLIGSFL